MIVGSDMVDSDLLDLFGDKWDRGSLRVFGFGAL